VSGKLTAPAALLLPGAELPLVENFGLLNYLFPFPSILDTCYPVLDFWSLYPREINSVLVAYEAGWAPELAYTFWRKETSVVHARI
jgi:hypothetical protein